MCEYPVERMARALLGAFPNSRGVAYSMLAATLRRLPFGLHIGMENVADVAELETEEAGRAVPCASWRQVRAA
jgi:hypothetical protein